MFRIIQYIFISLIFLLISSAGEAMAGDLRIEGIRYGMMGGNTRIVFDVSQKTDYRVFLLEKPYRIVVDIPAATLTVPKSRFVSDSLVKSYRSGKVDGGLTRVVFDINKPAIVKNTFFLSKDSFSKDRVVIDIAPSSENLFTARLAEIYGTKNIKAASTQQTALVSDAARLRQESVQQESPGTIKVAVPLRKPAPERKYTIVVDPGHGGKDGGAVSNDIREKDITLAIAKELKRQLEETGRYRVVLTRDKDVYIKLHERVDISRRVGGDLFISIHADKIGRNSVRGASIYTLSENASDAETARLAEDENNSGVVAGVDLRQESQDVANILLDLAMREKMNESNLLARIFKEAFQRKNVRLLPNSHRSAGFAVLKAPDVPAVLIETGFLSNPEEAKLLRSADFQRKISGAIVEGIEAYFRKIQALQKI